MPRRKNYGPAGGHPEVPKTTRPNAQHGVGCPQEPEQHAPVEPAGRPASGADIDIIAIVGKERPNPQGHKHVLLSPWLGRGIDAWVWALVDTLTLLFERNERSVSTLRRIGDCVARQVFEFLIDGRDAPLLSGPEGFTRLHANMFVAWLKKRTPDWESRGGDGLRINYSTCKSGIDKLHSMGFIAAPKRGLWPSNPFPDAASRRRGQQPLSAAEQQRLADALKSDIVNMHFGKIALYGGESATVHYVLIAMRTGSNPTPLLEAGRDAVTDALRADKKVLRLTKLRARKTTEKAVRDRGQNSLGLSEGPANDARLTELMPIPMDAVAIWRRQLELTAPLLPAAPSESKNSPWLYISASLGDEKGRVARLSPGMMFTNLGRIVRRHGIKGDDGKPLRLNIMRLRKSFAARAWRLSEGDPLQVAAMLGNTPRIAGMNYAAITEEIKEAGVKFLGEALFPTLRGVEQDRKVIPIRHESTPTASCLDPVNGDRAPGDGSLCKKFVLCLFCRSFAVVGTLDELWRFFSFQAFLQAELDHLESLPISRSDDLIEIEDLQVVYRRAIDHIDNWTALKFGKTLPKKAKAAARKALHPFWEIEVRRAKAARKLILKASPPAVETKGSECP